MTINLRDGSVAFVPRARLIKLLGGELIRDEVMAVAELVKNAHDADASRVTLTFRGASGADGEIIIEDDGCGMGADVLLQNWMQPAGSTKSRRDRHYTQSGRRMLGEKGVGRFAVDRLGRYTELVSRPKGVDIEIVAAFDWDEFEDDLRPLSDIAIPWREQRARILDRPGTRIRITGLRMPWKERTFRRLCTRLQRLLSPSIGDMGFEIDVQSDEFPDYQGPLKTSFFERATYRINAEFDGEESISCCLRGIGTVTHRWEGPGELTCGPARVTINCFDLETDALARVGPPHEVRAWLREWSGISIYRDGFRVLPYGEPDDDWLRLDQRRVNNPVLCLSNNQVCGYVEISRDVNPELRDQTNRGGLLQNRAYDDLRKLILFVLQIVEAERQVIRHPPQENPAPLTVETGAVETDAILDELKAAVGRSWTGQTSVRSLVDSLEQNLKRERAIREREIGAYLEMAAIGHGAGFASHALEPRLRLLRRLIRSLQKDQEKGRSITAAILQGESVLDELEETADLIGRIAPSRRVKARAIDVQAELGEFERSVVCLLSSHSVSLKTSLPEAALVRTEIPPADFHQVLHILLWNTLDWIGKQERKRAEVRVLRSDDEFCRLQFRDLGPGIPPELTERIFEPGFSTKPNGRGMGLSVARRLLAGSGGSITLVSPSRTNGWTAFEIRLRKKRSRVTPD